MRQREWERDLLRSQPATWRQIRALLAATSRHHPENSAAISTLRLAVHLCRWIGIVKELYERGEIDALTAFEQIGPILCPDSVARPDGWGTAG